MTQQEPKNGVKKILTSRKFIFTGLVLALILLCTYYSANYQRHLEHPNTGIILKDYPYGEMVAVSGEVKEVNNNGFILMDQYHGTDVYFTIFSSEKLSIGDKVEVLGVLGNSYQITASMIQIITGFDYTFMLVRSGIIVIIFLFFFRRYWRFNFRKMEFRRLK